MQNNTQSTRSISAALLPYVPRLKGQVLDPNEEFAMSFGKPFDAGTNSDDGADIAYLFLNHAEYDAEVFLFYAGEMQVFMGYAQLLRILQEMGAKSLMDLEVYEWVWRIEAAATNYVTA